MPTNPQMPLTDFKNLSDTDRSLIVWQGLTDTWAKLNQAIEFQKMIEADTKVHEKLLITGNGEPSLMERMRAAEKFIGNFGYWTRFIAGAIVVQTITFMFAIVVALFRFLPVLEKLASP